MATVFWDANGIFLIDYLEKGKTIKGAYYAALLDQLSVQIKEKRPHLAKKKVLSIKIMEVCTRQQSQCPNCMN